MYVLRVLLGTSLVALVGCTEAVGPAMPAKSPGRGHSRPVAPSTPLPAVVTTTRVPVLFFKGDVNVTTET